MKNINILPPAIYNRLAAGEVVENPASIVKELLENSIDANAQRITVQIINGGIDEIIVTDDGEGVDETNLPKVLLPHATSKIKQADDIDHITSLGFRGEAMASIASVAHVEFTSKPAGQDYAACINELNEIKQVGANRGTTVRVTDLFYNTPARKKFLHSATIEKKNIAQVIHEIIFAHPNLWIKYSVDDKIMIDYQAQGLAAAIAQIYDVSVSELLPIDYHESSISITGLITNPKVTKLNKERQITIVNDRILTGGLTAAIINETMSNYLPPKEYAVFVFYINLPVDQVDVNVHPQKRAVRFENQNLVKQAIQKAIAQTMDNYFLHQIDALIQPVKQPQPVEKMQEQPVIQPQPLDVPVVGKSFDPNEQTANNVLLNSLKLFASEENVLQSAPNILNSIPINDLVTQPEQISALTTANFKILGQIFETYLIVQTVDTLLIIDQHAMAERVNYDKFRNQIDHGTVQSQIMLTPTIIKLTPKELSRFESLQGILIKFGFDCDTFGETSIRVSAIPTILTQTAVNDFMSVLLNDKELVNASLSEMVKHKVATMACKASIRAGDVLSTPQIEKFLEHYFVTKNVPLCPHGRPIMLIFNQSKLESLFARK